MLFFFIFCFFFAYDFQWSQPSTIIDWWMKNKTKKFLLWCICFFGWWVFFYCRYCLPPHCCVWRICDIVIYSWKKTIPFSYDSSSSSIDWNEWMNVEPWIWINNFSKILFLFLICWFQFIIEIHIYLFIIIMAMRWLLYSRSSTYHLFFT